LYRIAASEDIRREMESDDERAQELGLTPKKSLSMTPFPATS